jgi:hypothetical protein
VPHPTAAKASAITPSMTPARDARRRAALVIAVLIAVIILACRSEPQLLPGISTVHTGTHLPMHWWMNRGPVG